MSNGVGTGFGVKPDAGGKDKKRPGENYVDTYERHKCNSDSILSIHFNEAHVFQYLYFSSTCPGADACRMLSHGGNPFYNRHTSAISPHYDHCIGARAELFDPNVKIR